MGRTAKFFRSLLGSSNSTPDSSSTTAAPAPSRDKKKSKWGLSKSADLDKFKNEDPLASPYVDVLDANKHAIAVAAATAAVAEAALAAAHAAAEVVRLTSIGGSVSGSGRNVPSYVSRDRRPVAAAIMIQSAFRAYLARRALRALKGLVKLQALVRGHIVRKQSADMLRRMQTMARIQARASATRSYIKLHPSVGAADPRTYHQCSDTAKHGGNNWLNHWMEQHSWNNRQANSLDTSHGDDKILEIDTWKPRQTNRRAFPSVQRNAIMVQERPKISSFSRLAAKLQKPNPSTSSEEVSPKEVDQVALWAAESSPRVHSASSRPASNARGVFTPTRSECSRSVLGDYLSHPSYMANTESSRAKVRSQSAPKQRMQLEATFGRNDWESDAVSEKGYQQPSQLKRQGAHTRGPNGNGIRPSYGYRF